MAFLEAFDPAAMRKTRKGSMLMLKAASQMNLASNDEVEIRETHSEGLLVSKVKQGEHVQEQEKGQEHGHHRGHVNKTTDKEAMVMSVSALYGKLLVFIGIGFPIAKGLSHDLPLIYYNSFYLYLYFGSILFVIYAYVCLLSSFSMQFSRLYLYISEFRAYIKPFTSSMQEHFSRLRSNFKKSQPKHFIVEESPESCKAGDSEYNSSTESMEMGEMNEESESGMRRSKFVYTETAGHGSMYLKMGSIVFGIGSMIYSGLEFGYYFELKAACSDLLMAITPASRMVFTFLQMYFIFLYSRVSISRHTTIARFGLMHMVATNLCIWLNVLVEETKHTIHQISHEAHESHDDHGHAELHEDDHEDHDNLEAHDSHGDHRNHEERSNEHDLNSAAEFIDDENLSIDSDLLLEDAFSEELNFPTDDLHPFYNNRSSFGEVDFFNITTTTAFPNEFSKLGEGYFDSHDFHNLVKRSIDSLEECRMFNLMGDMVNSSAPLLFPCTIEYSLLCASVLYVMWKNVQGGKAKVFHHKDQHHHLSQLIARKVRHLYSVDCGRASRGLFSGIFLFVLTLIALILFTVLVSEPHFKYYGILSANVSEILIYSVGIVTTIIGMQQLRNLSFIEEEETELDNILLVIAQGGVYMFTIFTLIGGYFSNVHMSALTLIATSVTLAQASLQTLYILDGSRRCCRTADQVENKYGREMVTFLLILNLSMWLFSTFQTSRAYMHKAQQEFYGIWAWTIINHVSMPLAIFYRFHATVCLGEIWKRAYKLHADE